MATKPAFSSTASPCCNVWVGGPSGGDLGGTAGLRGAFLGGSEGLGGFCAAARHTNAINTATASAVRREAMLNWTRVRAEVFVALPLAVIPQVDEDEGRVQDRAS
jgi:hypothetical protein